MLVAARHETAFRSSSRPACTGHGLRPRAPKKARRGLLACAALLALLVAAPALASKGGSHDGHKWRGLGIGHGESVTPPGLHGASVATKRKSSVHAAPIPELDPSGFAAAALLLVAGTLVLRDRRSPARRS